eukprot:16440258-Heterocapsa_arctica.AAC.1
MLLGKTSTRCGVSSSRLPRSTTTSEQESRWVSPRPNERSCSRKTFLSPKGLESEAGSAEQDAK